MDEYPPGSLDHSTPFLLTLGVTSGGEAVAKYDTALLSPALKEQAILIRSELPALEDQTAHALLKYIQERDASGQPCNGREATKRYRFRVRSAERVRTSLSICQGCCLPALWSPFLSILFAYLQYLACLPNKEPVSNT